MFRSRNFLFRLQISGSEVRILSDQLGFFQLYFQFGTFSRIFLIHYLLVQQKSARFKSCPYHKTPSPQLARKGGLLLHYLFLYRAEQALLNPIMKCCVVWRDDGLTLKSFFLFLVSFDEKSCVINSKFKTLECKLAILKWQKTGKVQKKYFFQALTNKMTGCLH